jgi:hypothetical protein
MFTICSDNENNMKSNLDLSKQISFDPSNMSIKSKNPIEGELINEQQLFSTFKFNPPKT